LTSEIGYIIRALKVTDYILASLAVRLLASSAVRLSVTCIIDVAKRGRKELHCHDSRGFLLPPRKNELIFNKKSAK
jgi:hypothetical protein